MKTGKNASPDLTRQQLLFLGISCLAAAFIVGLYFLNSGSFQPYFGSVNPVLVIGLSIILGSVLLQVHLSNGWFLIYRKGDRRGLLISSGLAVLFGGVIIIVDLLAVFPEYINVSFPQSLLFYPAIGFVVEIIFHLLPLTLLFGLFSSVRGKINWDEMVWPAIITVSLIEPVYQAFPGFGHQVSIWADSYVAVHIFLINLCQLWLFRRYDFVSMYLFRLVYYLIWHVGWGYLRLQLLF